MYDLHLYSKLGFWIQEVQGTVTIGRKWKDNCFKDKNIKILMGYGKSYVQGIIQITISTRIFTIFKE